MKRMQLLIINNIINVSSIRTKLSLLWIITWCVIIKILRKWELIPHYSFQVCF